MPDAADLRLDLVMAATPSYFPALAVVLRSVGEQLDPGWSVRARVFAPRDASWTDVARSVHDLPVDVERRLPSTRLDELPMTPRGAGSSLTYQRVLAADELTELERPFVYLDADVLVRRSIHQLVAPAVVGGHAPVAAVRDFGVPFVGSPMGIGAWRQLGLDPALPYFNSGVLVIDPVAWRRERVADRVFAHVTDWSSTMEFNDQEALNAVLAGRWHELSPTWNVQRSQGFPRLPVAPLFAPTVFDEACADPAVVHFVTRDKPWTPGRSGRWHDDWWEVLGRTAFADLRRPRTPLAERVRRARRHLRRAAYELLKAP